MKLEASSLDGHDLEQATPDERAPSRSWSLLFGGHRFAAVQSRQSKRAKANGPGLRPGHRVCAD
jgi:hypothetical protein